MISNEFRPQTFNEVAGQELVKNVLKAIVKNPETSPKTIILQGEYGTGKTTCARILSKALNCTHSINGDSCGECDNCKSDIDRSIFYEEFDSAMIGNVENIKSLRDTFYFDKDLGYKVLVLDEAQLITPQAQSALLKVLEENISGVFFIMCTTNMDKILPTIRSRSLKLKFELVSEADILANLDKIAKQKEIEVRVDILELISRRSRGHLRDAHILLDQYILLGEDNFKKSVQSSEELFYKLILNSLKGDTSMVAKIIEALEKFPLYQLKQDYEEAILNIIKQGINITAENSYIKLITGVLGNKLFQLIDILNKKEHYDSFVSDKRFQASMWIIVKDILISLKN